MGIFNWFRDRCNMMMRTKPHYISILGRKRSSIRSPPKFSSRADAKCGKKFGALICVVTMFCSVSYGVLLVLFSGVVPPNLITQLVSLVIAGIVAISGGLCLAEYINNQSQEVPSIYSCCYQYSSEILAFFIGWTWILSQTALIAAICKILAFHVNDWSDNTFGKLLDSVFRVYAKDLPSLIFVLIFILFILTGFGETVFWYILFIPVGFLMVAAIAVIGCISSKDENAFASDLSWSDIEGIDKVLTRSALSILFFTGPQSILRIPQVRRNTTAALCPLNGITLIFAVVFIFVASLSDSLISYPSSDELLSLVTNILYTLSLCTLAIESFYPLHYAIEDMSTDGLLFRSFSKKWKPFCLPVASCAVHVLSFVIVGLVSIFMPLFDVLHLAAVFPLLVHGVVPFLVLLQRYRDNNAWQYEPMFHTAARQFTEDKSKKKSLEFQYNNVSGFDITEERAISTACIDELGSDTSSDTDTDVDSVVQQYKDHNRVANLSTLEDSSGAGQQASEPTPSTAFRAKFGIVVLLGISVIMSITMNFADSNDHFTVIVIVLLCAVFSMVVQGLLMCLPQNLKSEQAKGCCVKLQSMPWTAGLTSLISSPLLVHVLIQTWEVCLGCFVFGFLLYIFYGIRSSTAATSFHNMRTTHITLRPLPSYGNNCIPQIIPSQRRLGKSRKQKKLKTSELL